MEIGLVRGLITAILLILFIGLWLWSWSKKRYAEYDAASQLPLEDDSQPPSGSKYNNETEQPS
jgi:cytochrome c oxidase cbb3-type subunit 4